MPSTTHLIRTARSLNVTLVLVLAVAFGPGTRSAAASDPAQVDGRIAGVASSVTGKAGEPVSAPSVSLLLVVEGSPVTVELVPETRVLDAGGTPQPASTLDLNEHVRAFGVWQSPTVFLAHRIEVVPQKP